MKHNNIMVIPEGEENEQELKTLFEEIMTKTSLIWQREKTYRSRKLRESKTSWTWRGLY